MRFPGFLVSIVFFLLLGVSKAEPVAPFELIVVIGAGGQPEYEEAFETWAKRWQELGNQTKAPTTTIGLASTDETTDRERLKSAIEGQQPTTEAPLIIVLIGHGTHLQQTSNFNLRGPDLGDQELARWLKDSTRPIAVVQCASASGPFLKTLTGQNRVVITATRNGNEQNYARFGDFFSNALTNTEADLDHDDAISMLEAFLFASNRVRRFYDQESRLATEHSLLDDNGDGLGTPANFFRGIRAVKTAKDNAALDGIRSHQIILFQLPGHISLSADERAKRNAIEKQIDALRPQKEKLGETAYYSALEPLMIQLAQLSFPPEEEQAAATEASTNLSTDENRLSNPPAEN